MGHNKLYRLILDFSVTFLHVELYLLKNKLLVIISNYSEWLCDKYIIYKCLQQDKNLHDPDIPRYGDDASIEEMVTSGTPFDVVLEGYYDDYIDSPFRTK